MAGRAAVRPHDVEPDIVRPGCIDGILLSRASKIAIGAARVARLRAEIARLFCITGASIISFPERVVVRILDEFRGGGSDIIDGWRGVRPCVGRHVTLNNGLIHYHQCSDHLICPAFPWLQPSGSRPFRGASGCYRMHI